ncbi:MAG TPA: hypothetical protein PL089_15105 [Ignavibacteria bacterium]|nr:hypothetical protein [Ignavibacteria bacterium]
MQKDINELTENEMSKKIAEGIKISNSNIQIGDRKNILIGLTCGVSDEVNLLFQSAEQDIVVYLSQEYIIDFENNDLLKKFKRSLPEDKVLIPLVIFEVKKKSVNTHTLRQYSQIAKSIKSIFPFCMYNLLLLDINKSINSDIDKVYMTAKNFDRVIYEKYNDKKKGKLITNLNALIEQHLEYLKNEKFFNLESLLKSKNK